MKFTANFNSFSGFWRSFQSPLHEVDVPMVRGNLRVQLKGSAEDPTFLMRFSSFGNVTYYELEKEELLTLADALVAVAEVGIEGNTNE